MSILFAANDLESKLGKQILLALFAIGCCILCTAPKEATSADDWERRGDTAFAAGQYAEAESCYTRAEEGSGEPGRVAFNHGVALFHLGKYRDAERLFRCSVESSTDSVRKQKAWFNLGTSLLYASDGQDANRLAEAMDCFHRCLNDAGDSALQADARHNLELAKQLWRRIRKQEPPPPENEPANDNTPATDNQPKNSGNNTGDPSTPMTGNNGQSGTNPAGKDGPQPMPTSQQKPGAGHLPPIPESEQAKPLSQEEARLLLRQAAERIARERKALQKSANGNEPRAYPDW
jgi:tetratricopeptide (TPR) repeat protein